MRPNAEMSSGQATFDLKAARQMCDRYTSWKTLNLHPECEPRCVSDAARELPAALDEIERQANRIAELEESLQRERAMAFSKIQRQRHAIARLSEAKRERGKALVEERAKRLVADRGDCPHRSPIKNQLISRCDKGIICDWCQCPIKDEWQDEAREQLHQEGKL